MVLFANFNLALQVFLGYTCLDVECPHGISGILGSYLNTLSHKIQR